MKDPGNEDVLENSMYENIKGESINCRFQVLGYQLQVRILFKHNRSGIQEPFFVVMFSCKKKGIC